MEREGCVEGQQAELLFDENDELILEKGLERWDPEISNDSDPYGK